ncbi:hypothetical protein [Streptomyces sp. NPDC002537]
MLPPTVTGQQALFAMKRTTLSIETVRSILARPLDGYEEAIAEAAVFGGEHGLSKAWVRKVAEMIRLALALRDAEGHDPVPEEALDELPYLWTAVGQVLARVGMLRPRAVPAPPRRKQPPKSGYVGAPPPPPPPYPRSCPDCDAWMIGVRTGLGCEASCGDLAVTAGIGDDGGRHLQHHGRTRTTRTARCG